MNFLETVKNDRSESVFIHLLNKFYRPKEKWTKTYRPSTISRGFCPRLWALVSLGLVEGYSKISAASMRKMDNGTYMHLRYHEYVKDLDAAYVDERYGDPDDGFKCQERLVEVGPMRGRYDAILDGRKLKPASDFLYLTDFKSINNEQFEDLTGPLDSHDKQLIMYLGMVDELYDLDRPLCGLYVYENKNDQRLKEFKIPWDDSAKQLYQELKELIRLSEEASVTGDLSKVPCLCKRKDRCIDWDLEELKRTPKHLDNF